MSVTIGTVPDGIVAEPDCCATDVLVINEIFCPPPLSNPNVCVCEDGLFVTGSPVMLPPGVTPLSVQFVTRCTVAAPSSPPASSSVTVRFCVMLGVNSADTSTGA